MPVRQVRQRRFTSNLLRSAFDAIPGKRTLGVYRFLPFFFFLGAGLEFAMINWTVGETNFCNGWHINPVIPFDRLTSDCRSCLQEEAGYEPNRN